MFSSSSDKCYNKQNPCPLTSVTNCSHSEDVTIECSKYRELTSIMWYLYHCFYEGYYSLKSKSDNKVPSVCSKLLLKLWFILKCITGLGFPSGNGVVRLHRNGVTSSSYYSGIVQIYINGQWGNICDDYYYNQFEADVICHQLGYVGASSFPRAGLARLSYQLIDNIIVYFTL